MKPFFSIIVPVYQAEATLGRCVQSVMTQTYKDYEVVLVDDGSGDNSGVLCDTLSQMDKRIQVIHQSNSGVSAARNTGIYRAQGEYLLFLDSDDALLPNALSIYYEATAQGTMDLVSSGLSVWENDREKRRIGCDEEVQAGNEIWERICCDPAPFGYAGGKVIRRSIVSENAIAFNSNMRSQEDLDFFLSAYNVCKTFHIIPDCLYAYYYTPSKRRPPVGDHLANQIKLLRIAKNRTELSPAAEHAVCSRVLSLLYTGLYCAFEEGCYQEILDVLQGVEGMRELLKSAPAKGEHGFIARNFAAERYRFIQFYFIVRRKLRDIVRLIKKR